MRLMSLQVRTSAKRRATRHRDHRFRPETPEGCEPRIVLDGAGGALTFEFKPGGSAGPRPTTTLTASIPEQHFNEICTTFTNTSETDQVATADLFYNPDMTFGAGQTLAYTQTVTVPAHDSVQVCFVVAPGQCYQMDTRPGPVSATEGNSKEPGAPYHNLGNWISYALFCVPETDHNGCFTQGYYKNHPDVVDDLLSKVGGQLDVGGVDYTRSDLIAILETPPKGDSRLILAHQLITAELNLLNGCQPDKDQLYAINQGNTKLDGVDLLDLSDPIHDTTMTAIADILDAFNNQDE